MNPRPLTQRSPPQASCRALGTLRKGAAGLKWEPATTNSSNKWWWTRPQRPLFASRRTRTQLGKGSSDPKVLLKAQTVATLGQARLPVEFKHINKWRKRNLQGFPW